ncbi:MAG: PEP-CTERM sorting domain-containing protein [Candidatus Auribacterota bacterium]|jgi:hypothetical protein|nr:PEP-CTERM sorting domain-containing protein [Candidatus Auribacterota bacterium]
MKQLTIALCFLSMLTTVATAQIPERGFAGAENEVKDPVFQNAYDTYQEYGSGEYGGGEGEEGGGEGEEGGGEGEEGGGMGPVYYWGGVNFNEDHFTWMNSGVSGFAFDHGQYPGTSDTLITVVDAMDSGLYDPNGDQQNIHLSFLAHIDNNGFVNVTIAWWDYIDQNLILLPDGSNAPAPHHQINLTFNDFDDDGEYESTFDNIIPLVEVDEWDPDYVYPLVYDMYWQGYDLFTFDATINGNPRYMLLAFEIGHDENAVYDPPSVPSSAYFTDVLFQQQSLTAPVPEPATFILILLGLAGIYRAKRRN